LTNGLRAECISEENVCGDSILNLQLLHLWHSKFCVPNSDPESIVLHITDITVYESGEKIIDTHIYVCVLTSNVLPSQSSVNGIWVRKSLLTCNAIWLFPEA